MGQVVFRGDQGTLSSAARSEVQMKEEKEEVRVNRLAGRTAPRKKKRLIILGAGGEGRNSRLTTKNLGREDTKDRSEQTVHQKDRCAAEREANKTLRGFEHYSIHVARERTPLLPRHGSVL